MKIELTTPLSKEAVKGLKTGDTVLLSGTVYAARDAAHKKMIEMLDNGMELPFDIQGQVIYYVGPCPAREGQVIGSAGPTTSSRMDAYAPRLIKKGLAGMIGKGLRSEAVIEAMKQYGAVYFGAIGGAGALIANSIVAEEVIAFSELGPEALRKLEVKDFECTVILDRNGGNLYELGRARYRRA